MEKVDKMIEMVIQPAGNFPVYNCMLLVNDRKRNISVAKATGNLEKSGKPISLDHGFRTGSITKPFTSAIILQLFEDGVVKPEDLLFDFLSPDKKLFLKDLHLFERTNYSQSVTIQQLLQHETGLPDYFSGDKKFYQQVLNSPLQEWNWHLVMERFFEYRLNEKTFFPPGHGFHYSDTNYLLLALLIEELTKQKLHEVFNEKIFLPLDLNDTYFEFFQPVKTNMPVVYPYYGTHSLKEVNTSFDWGGGGLISTMNNLDIFIRGLISGKLFKREETLSAMLEFKNYTTKNSPKRLSLYGLGLQKKIMAGYSFVGHASAYGSLMFYDPEKDTSIILSLNQAGAMHKAEWLMNKVAEAFNDQ